MVRFVIGGVQKSGTTALARYLADHPGIALPARKEAHVFDAPDFDEAAGSAVIDAHYAGLFRGATAARLHGDATPIYVLHPRFVRRIHRYNPGMKWILLLRHPVARAISHYHMERARGTESWPFWAAMLFERWRLRGHLDDFRRGSPLRRASYRLRGDYTRQIRALHALFPPEQVLLLDASALRTRTEETVARACDFLGVAAPPVRDYTPAFVGDYAASGPGSLRWRLLAALMQRELGEMDHAHGLRWDGEARA